MAVQSSIVRVVTFKSRVGSTLFTRRLMTGATASIQKARISKAACGAQSEVVLQLTDSELPGFP